MRRLDWEHLLKDFCHERLDSDDDKRVIYLMIRGLLTLSSLGIVQYPKMKTGDFIKGNS